MSRRNNLKYQLYCQQVVDWVANFKEICRNSINIIEPIYQGKAISNRCYCIGVNAIPHKNLNVGDNSNNKIKWQFWGCAIGHGNRKYFCPQIRVGNPLEISIHWNALDYIDTSDLSTHWSSEQLEFISWLLQSFRPPSADGGGCVFYVNETRHLSPPSICSCWLPGERHLSVSRIP